jgi:hypothetical protein
MNEQVITMVEGVVPENKWQALQEGYASVSLSPPEGIVQSYIMQGKADPSLWRLVTVWQSLEALKTMQQTHSVPPGIRIFRDVGVQPQVTIFEVRRCLR